MQFYSQAAFKAALIGLTLSFALNAWGAGKKSAGAAINSCPAVPAGSPGPLRPVSLEPVQSKDFPLPNGFTVNLSMEMTAMLRTAVTQSDLLSPIVGPAPEESCIPALQLHSTVTALELDLRQYKLKIGYTPGQTHDVALAGITGEVGATVGKLMMDFHLVKCHGGQCTTIAASSVNHKTVSWNSEIKLDFGLITAGPSFASNPSFSKLLQSLMAAGTKSLLAQVRPTDIPWHATVREFSNSEGTLLFDAGSQAHLRNQTAFVVYAASENAVGLCNVFKPVAYIRSTRVDPISTLAVVDAMLDARGIREGDIVLLR